MCADVGQLIEGATMARLSREHLGDMSDDGERVRARRERLGMGKRDLAELAGVSRDTLAAIEDGQGFRRSSLTKIERALDALEEEVGLHAPASTSAEDDELFTFEVTDPEGYKIVTSGRVHNAELLKQQVIDILREMRKERRDVPNGEA